MRLILSIIAVCVIVWIYWDHNRKNAKRNCYTKKKPVLSNNDCTRTDFGGFSKEIEYDIEREVFSSKQQEFEEKPKASPVSETKESLYFNRTDDSLEFDAVFSESQIDLEDIKYERKVQTPVKEEPLIENTYVDVQDNDDFDVEFNKTQEKTNPSTSHLENNGSDSVTNNVFTIYVRAKGNSKLNGDDLLHSLLSVGCRFGDMNIFHRHEKTSGQGRVMFSVSSMIKPGTFDINNMQDNQLAGIALFFTYPGTTTPLVVFDLMLKTAYKLAKHLDAEILDENRDLLSDEKATEMREKIEFIEVNEFF